MKNSTPSHHRTGLILGVLLAAQTVLGQSIPNPSFEENTFTVFPGYISGNTPISGWTATLADRAGLNPAGGSPFANNGAIPDGANVAFIQSPSGGSATLSTTISDLVPGTVYKVDFRANARGAQQPTLRVSIDATELLALTIYPVGGTAPYDHLAFEFTATAESQTLTLANDAAGDTTVLVDDFKIAPSSGRWSVAAWTGDADSGVDPSVVQTHAYNFGSGDSPVINGVTFTGIAGVNPGVAGQFSTLSLGAGPVNDTSRNISGGSATLGGAFVYGGTIVAGTYQTLTIQGLTPGIEYVATIYSVAWEDPSLANRWATFSVGDDRLTINQDKFNNNNGIRFSYRYVAGASGRVSLNISPINPVNVSIHCYGFHNQEVTPRTLAPLITVQPQSQWIADGQPFRFSVAAYGIPAPTYQWYYAGFEIGGATEASYGITQAFPPDAGDYQVVVSNSEGSVTSLVARLTVGLYTLNPSFELDSFTVFPGYVSSNFPITGWASLPDHGLNPIADGQSPFADNGRITHGTNVAFMQGDGVLSQVVSGFTPGAEYYLHYLENARTVTTLPAIEVQLAGNTIVPVHTITPVGGASPYRDIFSDVFVAASAEMEIAFIKSSPVGGDCTALIDNVAFIEVPAGTAPFIAVQPQSQGINVGESVTFVSQGIGSSPLTYQWRSNGVAIAGATGPSFTMNFVQDLAEANYSVEISNGAGSAISQDATLTVFEPIPDLFNTGVDNNRAPAADGSVDLHYALIQNADGVSPNAIIEDSTVFPIVTGPWLANTAQSKWIGPQLNTVASAVGPYIYRTTINLVDRDPATVVLEGHWAVDNAGVDILVNGVTTGNPQAPVFTAYTPFTISSANATFVAGTNTIDFVVHNLAAVGYTGLRAEFLRSNVKIPAGVSPQFTSQPIDIQQGVEGGIAVFSGSAVGSTPLSYKWYKNGQPLANSSSPVLTLTNLTQADSGVYTLEVSNPAGQKTSTGANLCVCLRPLPGVYSTGVDDAGGLLPQGAVDTHYVLSASADPTYVGPEAYVVSNAYPIQAGSWLLNGPVSKWIAPWANQNNSGTVGGGNAGGDYTYQTMFDLTGYDVSQLKLVGRWATDNTGLDILLNGVSTGVTSPGFGGFTQFTLTGLLAGPNVLDFQINNATNNPPSNNPTGLRVDLNVYQNIHWPDTTQPVLTLTPVDQTLSIGWAPINPCQRLQGATTITGPWVDLPPGNPYNTGPLVNQMQFFRIYIP